MRQVRLLILITISLLIAIGIIMIYSSSAIYAHERLEDSFYFLKRHLLFLLIGTISTIFVMTLNYEILKKYSPLLVACSMLLLVLVLIPGIGYEAGGARRWFRIWGFGFQPSEAAKWCLIIYFAQVLSKKGGEIKLFLKGFLPPAVILGASLGLILLEPDLGTAISIALIAFIMFFVAGARIKHMAYTLLAALPFLYFAIFRTPYRRNRILAFLNPWQDPKGTGFQIIQSFLALGSGGLIGVGLGQSKQKLFYLPASHTDFIFSIIGEELGLLGTFSVLALFFVFALQGMKISLRCSDDFGRLLSLGIVSMITLEAVIHIGVSIGSIPTKGLPLPFISYGGSSLVFHMMAVGILLNVARGSRPSRGIA
jgi:cell division protein FtsW